MSSVGGVRSRRCQDRARLRMAEKRLDPTTAVHMSQCSDAFSHPVAYCGLRGLTTVRIEGNKYELEQTEKLPEDQCFTGNIAVFRPFDW